jgi:hypothetical protein
MLFVTEKIFCVIETIIPVVETTVSATNNIFSEAEMIPVILNTIFFAK